MDREEVREEAREEQIKTEARQREICRTTLWIAAGVMAVGCGMLIAAMSIPPPGVIDHSILVAFGEISTFSGALLGVRLRLRRTLS